MKTHTDKLVNNTGTLIVARNVLTDEMQYFLSNRVPGRNSWSLRKIPGVAFGRWPVKDCFRETKEELGLDHFKCRGWWCIQRHLFITILCQLFCARVRQQLTPSENFLSGDLLNMEQIRRAANVVVDSLSCPPRTRERLYTEEAACQSCHARRNAQASKSHPKTRRKRLIELGIDAEKIKSVPPKHAILTSPPTQHGVVQLIIANRTLICSLICADTNAQWESVGGLISHQVLAQIYCR